MNSFDVTVWYRYVSNGEQEKDLEIINVLAINEQEAVNKASEQFCSFKQIPFQYLVNGKIYKPIK